ncbi:stage V sporulation protein AE [Alkalithermobacter paradoxus]|uniref:SpoVA protein n=1 Tax=Alkalithermobacter paradoxus TaxID=29349 RepID=A0A1V4IB17_9FIRM|nr:SpoVA protein [[Clostridium] thermoalcaliphilum]
MDYLWAFIIGGTICLLGQILMDFFKIPVPYIMVTFVTSGVILTALGLYEPIIKLGGAGASVPLPGFGYALAKGVIKEVSEKGFLGAFTGGTVATAGGIAAAVFFGYVMAVIFTPKTKP